MKMFLGSGIVITVISLLGGCKDAAPHTQIVPLVLHSIRPQPCPALHADSADGQSIEHALIKQPSRPSHDRDVIVKAGKTTFRARLTPWNPPVSTIPRFPN